MDEFPFDGEGILRVAVAKKIGIDPHRIYRAAREHKIEPLVPGVYVLPTARRPVHRHRLEALSASVGPGTVISHSSAAVVHQLAMLRPDLSRLHITAVEGSAGYRRSHRFLHPGRLAEADIVEVDGVRLTSPARTAFDVARTSPAGFPGSLAVFDSALRAHVDVDLLAGFCRGRQRNVGIARTALELADGLSENPGESWSRAQMILAGLPTPELQVEIFDEYHLFVARPDFVWRDATGAIRVAGEFDGLGKYLDYLREGETPQDVIAREKRREAKLEDMGILVVRWTWDDLHAQVVVGRVRRKLQLAGLV
ncbi:MAG TPA: hypothetical protein PK331_14750 [Gordonia sp. (in: high G+C Gram-positive bacteria)]|mgnify:CR=1 FL=1|uniref:type IV toxin-antitoxin system AbiEi family antitoxin domain-containing protein n=1 Tax=unclassified Gordonia (in: high G+C Gram-positive bacteria) TaxID=2657482 RepID=UPI000FC13984|nr:MULTISPECIES: hypothetical protein [unclassified Gordonia (in: high G+C Gram-positive bacteria)]RUP39665.1 MAG: hypothetical protein EKK60_06515 [Gordonia sp. (in: high G+C Gram-positive bacteria)]HNP58871.1 hypothetical protein [Gordonia sp. (in: high G+C Gram-positive bacteria)]HRC52167.1 hypothetical protein [Gordonia sp. (in: high G+C Gram-positive bacteria)]